MSKEERKKKAPRSHKVGLRIIFSSVIMAGTLLGDFYAMLNYPKLIWLMGSITLVFVLAVYCFASSIMQFRYEAEMQQEEMHNELYKSAKATYLMMRKYFDEIQEQLDDMEDKMGIPVDDIMNAQKGIAKVTISRSKENTDALMNSNDKLLEKVIDFEEMLSEAEDKILMAQRDASHTGNQEILIKQQELANLIKEIEVSLRKEILSLESIVKSQPQQVVMTQPSMVTPQPAMESYMHENTVEIKESSQPEQTPIPDEMLDEMVSAATEQMEEATSNFESGDTVAEVISFENALDSMESEEPEPEVAAESEVVVEPEVAAEPEVVVEPEVTVEPESIPEQEIATEPEPTPEPEPVSEPEVAVEPEPEPVPEPEVVVEPEPEPVPEPEVAVEPEPEPVPVPEPAEEKPPMPDMTDPGHVMTPDEIAALLANM
ncbi:hypothetical protein SAMN02910358_01169 [Lachnospiraceae bacterium XBB1006]|nr:hypothetical protein SAMN02910358_01169 [Lachnospiraceae bacterium XBB1006]